MRYLRIMNDGLANISSLLIFGVSTARGKENKIGQFGSGFKHGISVCLRNGINPVITSGNKHIVFDCISRSIDGVDFDQVTYNMNGEIKELSFATQFGEIDWTSLDMAIREFVSNAIDQTNYRIDVVDTIESFEDKTCVYIEYTPIIADCHKKLNKVFLHIEAKEKDTVIYKESLSKLRLYRKGVLVYEGRDDELSLCDYNLSDIRLNESRNLDSYMVPTYLAMGVLSEVKSAKLLAQAINKGIQCVEVEKISYIPCSKTNKLIEAVNELKWNPICTPDMAKMASNKSPVTVVPVRWFAILQDIGIKTADFSLGNIGAKNGYMEVEVPNTLRSNVRKVWRKMEKFGLTAGKPMPNVKAYNIPMNCGTEVQGYYELGGNTIYLNQTNCSTQTIIEEIAHYVTQASDATRDFQDYAFKLAACLI